MVPLREIKGQTTLSHDRTLVGSSRLCREQGMGRVVDGHVGIDYLLRVSGSAGRRKGRKTMGENRGGL